MSSASFLRAHEELNAATSYGLMNSFANAGPGDMYVSTFSLAPHVWTDGADGRLMRRTGFEQAWSHLKRVVRDGGERHLLRV